MFIIRLNLYTSYIVCINDEPKQAGFKSRTALTEIPTRTEVYNKKE